MNAIFGYYTLKPWYTNTIKMIKNNLRILITSLFFLCSWLIIFELNYFDIVLLPKVLWFGIPLLVSTGLGYQFSQKTLDYLMEEPLNPRLFLYPILILIASLSADLFVLVFFNDANMVDLGIVKNTLLKLGTILFMMLFSIPYMIILIIETIIVTAIMCFFLKKFLKNNLKI